MFNNKGFGSKDVMMVVCVMFVAVLVTMFTYNKNFKTLFEGETDKKSLPEKNYEYHKLENTLQSSAKKYYKETFDSNEIEEIPAITVTSKILKDRDYIDLVEANDETCEGYVNIVNNDGHLSYYPYIKCENYQTEGYTANLNN